MAPPKREPLTREDREDISRGLPTAARVGAAAGAAHGAAYDSAHAYTFGLQRVLDGLGALIDTSGT